MPSVRIVFDSAKSTHRQSKLIDDKTSGYWSSVFRTHPYSYNFIVRFHPYGIDLTAGHFSLGTTLVVFVGHSLNLLISASGTSWTHSMRRRKRFNPRKNPPSDDQPLLSRMTHSLLPSTNTSYILNFSAKLTDTLQMIVVILKNQFLTQLCRNHLFKNFHFLPFPRTPQTIFNFNWGELSRYDYRSNQMEKYNSIVL